MMSTNRQTGQRILPGLFDHKHFKRPAAGDQLQPQLILEGLFQTVEVRLPVIRFLPFQVNIKGIGELGGINDRNIKTVFEKKCQRGQVGAPAMSRCAPLTGGMVSDLRFAFRRLLSTGGRSG